ncbi:transcription termination factor MTERF15, mitochondrial-like [Neltuma alba]|nr:transcription termination factor MTERF15, mitochondrial-like [Prosopis alba]
MSRSLRKATGVSAISPLTFQHLICVQTQWFSSRYAYSTSANGHSFTVSYLIDTCGLSPKQAASASKCVSFETRDKPDLVINFLKSHGFSQPQIIRFITDTPSSLRYDPEKTFLPKIEFFKSRGFSSLDIPKLICSYPRIMSRSLRKQLIPSFNFFRDVFQSDDKLIKTLRIYSGILVDANTIARPNMELLREAGVPESNVIKFLQYNPRTLTASPNVLKDIVEEVNNIGINPLKYQFLMAVHVFFCLSKSSLAKRADVYKKWGWSDHDILVAFRKFPLCMVAAEDKIDAIMEFLVHKLGFESSTVSKYPTVFTMSFRRRIVPRGAVIQALLSRGLMKKKTLLTKFVYSESYFLRKFVLCHGQEATELLELYQSKLHLARQMKNGKV